MSAEEPDFSSHHINPAVRRKSLGESSTTDFAASMGTSQAVDSIEAGVGKSMNVEKKRMIKKIFLLSQEKLDYYLSFRPKPVSRRLVERDPAAAAEKEKLRERILSQQEQMRREYEANGHVTYVAEVPDDGVTYQGELGVVDEEEKYVAAAVVKEAEVAVDEKKEEDASFVKQAEVAVDEKKEEDASFVKQAEVAVDEKKEEYAAGEAEVTEDAAPLTFPHGRGRRRFRPGVVKQAGGGFKKIVGYYY